MAEVDPEHEARGAIERQQRRRAALLGGPVPARGASIRVLDDQAAGLEVGDERRDGGAREAREAGELGAARTAAAAQGVDELAAVALPERLERA